MIYQQSTDAYMKLIQLLLDCSDGREVEILKLHQDLLSAGFVNFTLQYASHLNKQGHINASQWLLSLAEQAMLVSSSKPITASTNVERSQQESVNFLMEAFELIAESRGKFEHLHMFLAQNQHNLNETLLQNFSQIVKSLKSNEIKQQLSLASILGKFGNLINQFPLGHRRVNLELGILAYQIALETYTYKTHPEIWAATQNNLALAYTDRILGKRIENLELALDITQSVLRNVRREMLSERWADAQHNLGIIYSSRIHGDRAENLEMSIAACDQATQVYTRKLYPEDWAAIQNNLAVAYNNRIIGSRANNLELAIEAYKCTLEVRTRERYPEWWAQTQVNLSNVYSLRLQGDRAENLELAINAAQKALQVFTRERFPDDWAKAQHNLAAAYGSRLRGDRAENLELAIASFHLVSQIYTYEKFPERWAKTQISLALAYTIRIRGSRAENVELAINAAQQALQVYTREKFPEEWAHTHETLALAYIFRSQGDRAENMEIAIDTIQNSLNIYTYEAFPENWATLQHDLAKAYSIRVRGKRSDNLQSAVLAYQNALKIKTSKTFPRDCRMTARNLGNLYFEQGRWQDSFCAYNKALTANEILYQSCILLESKAVELAEAADLSRRTAYAYAHTNNLPKALEILEQGRARGLSESLDRDRASLDQLQQQNPDLYNQYKDLTNQIRNLESIQRDRMVSNDRHTITPETLRNEATRIRQQLTETIDQIRQQPGYEAFLTLPTFADVQQAVSSDRPLVYLVTTSAGSLALIVTPNVTESVWLDNFTETQLTELLQGWFAAYEQSQSNRQAWYNAIDTTTRQIWDLLVGSIVEQLRKLGCDRAILIPTGYLSFLPLHAAWTEASNTLTGRRYALDDIHFTYSPNAKSLTAAQVIADRTPADTILAIDNPRQDLLNSEREIQQAIHTFLPYANILRHDRVTTTAVKAALPNVTIAHFSCHGTANLTDPLNSGLLMSDGLLTLKDIFALNLTEGDRGIRLAILSACETGMVGTENADEAVSLPTGLLQAGVAGVIASLWSVSDLSTMLLLSKFYELWRTKNKEPSEALRQAQIWLRDSTAGEIANFSELFTPTPDDRSYAHPFHWAAFSYTGI